jgi:hypothetical protein
MKKSSTKKQGAAKRPAPPQPATAAQPSRIDVAGVEVSEPEAIALATNYVKHTDLGRDEHALNFLLLLYVLAYHPDRFVREAMLLAAVKEAAPCLVSFSEFIDESLTRRMTAIRAGGAPAYNSTAERSA